MPETAEATLPAILSTLVKQDKLSHTVASKAIIEAGKYIPGLELFLLGN